MIFPRLLAGCPPEYKHTQDLSDGFFEGLIVVAKNIGAQPIHLLKVMNLESGVSAHRQNAMSSAVGLIQFMSKTLEALHWEGTREEFGKLTAEAQLPYVQSYYKWWAAHGLETVARLYMATLLPACLSAHDSRQTTYVLCAAQGPLRWAYTANRVLDVGHKGYITVRDLSDVVESYAKGERWNECAIRLAHAEMAREEQEPGGDAA